MMKAHELIDRASFGPDALKAIGRAFDESWVSLASNFADDQIETARLRLADVLLSIANDYSRDVETLKNLSTGCALDQVDAAHASRGAEVPRGLCRGLPDAAMRRAGLLASKRVGRGKGVDVGIGEESSSRKEM
jgi:hypothetical protein